VTKKNNFTADVSEFVVFDFYFRGKHGKKIYVLESIHS